MSRPPSLRSRPSLSLSPALLARARAYLAANPVAHPSLSALVDAALLAYLDSAETRARYDAAEPLPADEIDMIEIRVDNDGDPAPFQAAARALYRRVERVTIRRSRDSEVFGSGCSVSAGAHVPRERVAATERRLDHEGWRRSKVSPPDWQRPAVLTYCQKIGAPPPAWL